MASAASSELVVDTARFVAFGPEDIESTRLANALGEFDVGSTSGHVCCDGNGASLSCVADDGGFSFVVFCVEDLEVFDADFLEELGEEFGFFDGDGTDEDRSIGFLRPFMLTETVASVAP